MKRFRGRSAVSQSADLLMILTATLAVGGVMYAAVSGLAGGASNVPALSVVSKSLNVGTSGAGFAITLKNSGNVVLTGAPTLRLTGMTVPISTTIPSSTGTQTWTCTTDATGVATGTYYSCTAASFSLSAGSSISLSFYLNSAGGITAGNTYTVSGTIGGQSFSTPATASSS